MRTGWHLRWQGENLWHLANESGENCTDIEVWAVGIQLDGRRRNYVRSIASLKHGEHADLILSPVFGAGSGTVNLKVNGGGDAYSVTQRVDL